MNTPIYDFVSEYINKKNIRLHMPGHKGVHALGIEDRDITEFFGADDLYNPQGIIAESEKNASRLFGCPTFYSTEGSSHCIRAMVYLASIYAKSKSKKPCIGALCNAHKAFLTAVVHLDVQVKWIYPEERSNYISCSISPAELENLLKNNELTAFYVTSPDYLGNMLDIKSLARICHKYDVLLMVDNAHGAYTHFLSEPSHPMDLGADLCCDSAHKTLPVLTGGAYLHVNNSFFKEYVKKALMLFGTTSPSYLIMQSLDLANLYLSDYKKRLADYIPLANELKENLKAYGWKLYGDEEIKITLCTKAFGYIGEELEQILIKNKIVCEFADPDFLVIMLCPEIDKKQISVIKSVLTAIPQKEAITEEPPVFTPCEQAVSPREAALTLSETVNINDASGRILATPCVACPPAIPIVMCGQIITDEAIRAFKYYGITHCEVLK